VLTRRKTTRRVSARWTPQEPAFEAYEIHTGRTTRDPGTPASLVANGAPEGCMSADQRIRGTYLHGLFEAADSRRHLWNWLRDLGHNMADPGESGDARALREIAYDRLAGALGRALDPRAFALLGLRRDFSSRRFPRVV